MLDFFFHLTDKKKLKNRKINFFLTYLHLLELLQHRGEAVPEDAVLFYHQLSVSRVARKV